jgi:peroxiredoxin
MKKQLLWFLVAMPLGLLAQVGPATTPGQQIQDSIDFAGQPAIGSMAPDFTQNDTAGHPVQLSSFRGQYVLIDFWASWCRPCRKENPHVVEAFHRFKDKGFTVMGISLDKTKEEWIAAIGKDSLTWTQVSDLKGWNNVVAETYGVRRIPGNFLLDPEGKIIATNLRGNALQNKLEEILH